MPSRRTLTVGELTELRRLGDAVRHAGRGDRGPAVLLVVQSVCVYRARGSSLSELGRALGVELMVLRGLDQHTAKSTRSTAAAGLWSPPPSVTYLRTAPVSWHGPVTVAPAATTSRAR